MGIKTAVVHGLPDGLYEEHTHKIALSRSRAKGKDYELNGDAVGLDTDFLRGTTVTCVPERLNLTPESTLELRDPLTESIIKPRMLDLNVLGIPVDVHSDMPALTRNRKGATLVGVWSKVSDSEVSGLTTDKTLETAMRAAKSGKLWRKTSYFVNDLRLMKGTCDPAQRDVSENEWRAFQSGKSSQTDTLKSVQTPDCAASVLTPFNESLTVTRTNPLFSQVRVTAADSIPLLNAESWALTMSGPAWLQLSQKLDEVKGKVEDSYQWSKRANDFNFNLTTMGRAEAAKLAHEIYVHDTIHRELRDFTVPATLTRLVHLHPEGQPDDWEEWNGDAGAKSDIGSSATEATHDAKNIEWVDPRACSADGDNNEEDDFVCVD